MTRCLIWVSVVGFVFAGVASASVQQGDTEFELLGGLIKEGASGHSGLDLETWFASVGLGYFLTDNLQLMGSGFGFWTEADAVNEVTNPTGGTTRIEYDVDVVGIGGKARWFFLPKNQWVPYAGAELFYTDADVKTRTTTITNTLGESTTSTQTVAKTRSHLDGVLWGPLIGLRFELNATNDFFAEYQYHIWDGRIGRLFDDGHAIFLGIVHQFK
jgi:hypothetical protein